MDESRSYDSFLGCERVSGWLREHLEHALAKPGSLGHGVDYTQCATRAFDRSCLRGALAGGWLGLRRGRAISAESILADFWVFLEIERDAFYTDSRWFCCAR